MPRNFIHEDFMLTNSKAVELYHGSAKNEPIIDYHNHLVPGRIADNTGFENMAQVWLYGDHYKWRQMRTNGIEERLCTGNAGDWEKFLAWSTTVPKALGNPLYHWTHLELARYFGIDDRLLNEHTAKEIWEECNAQLRTPEFAPRRLLERMKVVAMCTTDDPVDSLEHHRALAADTSFKVKVYPTFRPDKAMAVDSPPDYNRWVDTLAQSADMAIESYSSLIEALRRRHDFFHEQGCRLSDHGLETVYAADYTDAQLDAAFTKVRSGKILDAEEAAALKSAVLVECGLMDAEKGWTQQLHLGALRNNNSRMYAALGADTGFDSIGDFEIARPLSRFLDRLDSRGSLPKTILYNLNPRDNELLATMLGNFQDGSVPGKMQFGSGWWFLDQKDGIERQLRALGNLSLLSRFVGMLTDSRSLLSFPRHEYFRRVLCNLLGTDMAQGVLPDDMELVGGMVRDISYGNAASYFGFEL